MEAIRKDLEANREEEEGALVIGKYFIELVWLLSIDRLVALHSIFLPHCFGKERD